MKLVPLRGVQPPPQAEQMLEILLKHLRMKRRASALFARHPSLGRASLRLVWFVSPHLVYPYGGKSIAEHCLARALRLPLGSSRDVRPAFVRGLLINLSMLMEIKVAAAGVVWNPVTDEPLSSWLLARPEATVEPTTPRPGSSLRKFTASIAARLLDATDYQFAMGGEGDAS